jgi:hypothetical protein
MEGTEKALRISVSIDPPIYGYLAAPICGVLFMVVHNGVPGQLPEKGEDHEL